MGIFEFILSLMIFSTVVSGAVAYVAGRAAWRGGKKLLGWARNQKRLGSGVPQDPTVEAQDVVVEPVEDVEPAPVEVPRRRPQTPAQRAQAAREARQQQRRTYVRLDPDAGATSGDVIKVMAEYVDDQAVGSYAQTVIDTLDAAELRHQSFFTELDGTFQRGSISWDKFAAPSYAAFDSILRNSALLANRIQAFDSASYLRLLHEEGQLGSHAEDLRNSTRTQRLKLFRDMLAGLDAIQETNEGLLLELDKLSAELVSLSASSPTEQSDRIIEEIRRLVDEAKYYK